jgi:hypothetical protein
VRKELVSVRWRSIYAVSGLYAVLVVLHGVLIVLEPQPVARESAGGALGDAQALLLLPSLGSGTAGPLGGELPGMRVTPAARRSPLANLAQDFALDDPHECGVRNAKLALGQFVKLQAELPGSEHPLLVLGGVGDSGTRAVAYIVTQLGVWMGKYGLTVKKDSRDSKLFINGFETSTCDWDNEVSQATVQSYNFYSKSIEACRSLLYSRDCVAARSARVWNQGVQWTSALVRTLLNHTRFFTAHKANQEMYPFGLWGFKHPRSSFLLPYLHYVTAGRLRYLHITRDGRDIANGDNQLFFNSVCKRYHGVDSPLCEDVFENRVELWSRLNLDVLRWARLNLQRDEFLVVRIEDLVKGHRACFDRIARFVRTDNDRAQKIVTKSIHLFTVKQDRYFGNKYSPRDKQLFTGLVQANPVSRRAFEALGYDIANWGTKAEDCSDLDHLAWNNA